MAAGLALHQFARTLPWISLPAPLLAVGTGITMVAKNPGIGFGDLWVIIALTLLVVSLILAGGTGGAYEKKFNAHRAAGTADSKEYGVVFRSFLRVNAIEMVAVLVVVAMMVFRSL